MRRFLILLLLISSTAFGADRIQGNGTWFKFQGQFYLGCAEPHAAANAVVGNYALRYRPNDGLGKAFRSDGSFILCCVSIDDQSADMHMYGTLNFSQYVVYDGSYTDVTSVANPLPKFTVIHISSFKIGDRDGDGVPDGDDPDPDDPDKKKPDKDGDGTPDEDDCNPDDPTNSATKPNCYRCDDGKYARDLGGCDVSDKDYDNAAGTGKDGVDWEKLKKDMKIFLARVGIDFDSLKGIHDKPKPMVIKYPIGIGADLSASSVEWGEYKVDVDPNGWEPGTIKEVLLMVQPWVKNLFKLAFAAFFMFKVMRLMYAQ